MRKSKINDLDICKEYYGYNNEKAKEALEVLTSENIEDIKSKLAEGGVEKNDYKYRRDGGMYPKGT